MTHNVEVSGDQKRSFWSPLDRQVIGYSAFERRMGVDGQGVADSLGV